MWTGRWAVGGRITSLLAGRALGLWNWNLRAVAAHEGRRGGRGWLGLGLSV